VNLTLSRNLDDLAMPGTLAAGVEYRTETYAITPGELLSSQSGGAQGFPGFAPRIPVDNSRNIYSAFAGLILRPLSRMRLSVDWYRIKVRDRIVLSDQLSAPQVVAIRAANGVTGIQQVQFFTNAAKTRTTGIEAEASYDVVLGPNAGLTASVQYGIYHTTLRNLAPNIALPALLLLGPKTRALLISTQQRSKLVSSIELRLGAAAFTASLDRYGSWVSAPLNVPQTFPAKTVADIGARVGLSSTISVSACVLNIGNAYPGVVKGFPAMGLNYGEESPFGINGRSYYLRVTAKL
jgi:iron complex outermembrane receptor protein